MRVMRAENRVRKRKHELRRQSRRRVGRVAAWTASLIVAALTLVPAAFGQDTTAPVLNDANITRAVEDQILFDEAVRLNDIDVETIEGVVTLSGDVNNILAKERAAALAGTVRGVRSIVNEIDVRPLLRTDNAIKEDIIVALAANPATESYDVRVTVDQGVVTLKGTVESWTESELCATVAKGVRGVTGLKNEIEWRVDRTRSDADIEKEIEEALSWDVLVDAEMIEVDVEDGRVALSGKVASLAERSRATSDAWVSGVDSVTVDELEIEPNLRGDLERMSAYQPRADEDIADAVSDALLYDPRVYSPSVEVDVEDGIVHLSGELNSLAAKRHAKMAARNTAGVIGVRNRIRVRSEGQLDDEIIEERVTAGLRRNPYTEPYEVTVSAENGVVDLYGSVDSYFEKAEADNVASNVDGVYVVDNNLVVKDDRIPYIYSPYVDDAYLYGYGWYEHPNNRVFMSDREIRESINDELWWSPFVDSEQVGVTVEAGIATLTGRVDTWSEWRAARENAFEGGASWVVNDLEVGPVQLEQEN